MEALPAPSTHELAHGPTSQQSQMAAFAWMLRNLVTPLKSAFRPLFPAKLSGGPFPQSFIKLPGAKQGVFQPLLDHLRVQRLLAHRGMGFECVHDRGQHGFGQGW